MIRAFKSSARRRGCEDGHFFSELKRRKRLQACGFFCALRGTSLFEIASLLVRLDHLASFIVNANYSMV
jgi:hypothetical protein